MQPHHSFDLYTHTARTVAGVPRRPRCGWRRLHDIAKPACFTKDEAQHRPFYGHAAQGRRWRKEITHRLRLDSATCTRVTQLVKWHDTQINPEARAVKRALRMTPPVLFQLLALQRADRRGAKKSSPSICPIWTRSRRWRRNFCGRTPASRCGTWRSTGMTCCRRGVAPGQTCRRGAGGLLDAVIDGKAENTKQALLAYLKTMPQAPESEA